MVITPMDDSPALEAGVLPGDVILSVDGTSTQGAGAAHLEELLPGEPGYDPVTDDNLPVERSTP